MRMSSGDVERYLEFRLQIVGCGLLTDRSMTTARNDGESNGSEDCG